MKRSALLASAAAAACLAGLGAQGAAALHEGTLSPALMGGARAAGVALVCIASAYIAQAVLYTQTERRALHGDLAGTDDAYEMALQFPMPGPNLAVSRQFASIAPRLPALGRGAAFAANTNTRQSKCHRKKSNY